MKKILSLILALIAVSFTLAACGDDPDPITYHSVAFDSNGAEKYTTREIAHGTPVIEPVTPERGGYYFTGWYSGDKLWDFEKDTVTEDITLVAGWKRITYVVSFDTAGGEGAYNDTVVPAGDPVNMPAEPVRDGYSFRGWYYNAQPWDFESAPVLNDMTLIATWEEITVPVYKVVFDSVGGTRVPEASVLSGESVAAPVPPTKSGHNFVGWTLGGASYDFEAPVTENITLVAVWEVIPTYTVTFDSNGGSAVESQHPVLNSAVAKPHDPTYPTVSTEIRDASFLGWYLGDVLYDFSTPVTSDITLVAKWSVKVYYKVTFEAEGDPNYPQTFTLAAGETVPVLRPSKDNFRFRGWLNGTEIWNVSTDLPTSNITLTADWAPIPTYRVVFDTNGGSTVAVQTVMEGGYVSTPAIPTRQGHRFDGWYSGETLWNFDTMTVTGPLTLSAKWVEQVKVEFKNEKGDTIYARMLDKGSLIPTYIAPSKPKHRFDGWLSGDVRWEFETMTANTDTVLTPKYVRQYTVTFDTDCDIEVPSQVVDENGFVTRPNTPQRGSHYSFDGWYIQYTEIKWEFSGDDRTPVTSDVILVAHWSIMTPPDVFGK